MKLSNNGRTAVHASLWAILLAMCVFAGATLASGIDLKSYTSAAGWTSNGTTTTSGQLVQMNNTATSGVGSNSKAFEAAGYYNCNANSGHYCTQTVTNGARWDVGSGASDYFSSDGTTVTFAGPIATSGNATASGGFISNNSNSTALQVAGAGGKILIGTALVAANTAPTITSAGTSPSVTASSGTMAFRVNVGTGGTATTIVLALPTATTGWNCFGNDITAAAANRNPTGALMLQSSTTTAATLQYQTVATGVALAFTASDIVAINCVGF